MEYSGSIYIKKKFDRTNIKLFLNTQVFLEIISLGLNLRVEVTFVMSIVFTNHSHFHHLNWPHVVLCT